MSTSKISSETCKQTDLEAKPRCETSKDQACLQRLLKYGSLFCLVFQNASLALTMNWSRQQHTPGADLYITTTAVVSGEVIKFVASLLMLLLEEGFGGAFQQLAEQLTTKKKETFQIMFPAVCYLTQNNLLFVAASNLSAPVYQVLSQGKLIVAAFFSVILLRRHLSWIQWFSIVALAGGIGVAQSSQVKAKEITQNTNPLVGAIALLVVSLLSGFAGVYIEKVLKEKKASVWVRNIQLSLFGLTIGLLTAYVKDGEKIVEKGFFFGYNHIVMSVILLQSLGGLLTAVVVKYADNILKGFATSFALIMTSVISAYVRDFTLTPVFGVGSAVVIVTIVAYSAFPYKEPPKVIEAKQEDAKDVTPLLPREG